MQSVTNSSASTEQEILLLVLAELAQLKDRMSKVKSVVTEVSEEPKESSSIKPSQIDADSSLDSINSESVDRADAATGTEDQFEISLDQNQIQVSQPDSVKVESLKEKLVSETDQESIFSLTDTFGVNVSSGKVLLKGKDF